MSTPVHNNKPELFILSKEILKALSREEVEATFKDMIKMGLAKAPYHKFSIQLSSDSWYDLTDDLYKRPRGTSLASAKVVINIPVIFEYDLPDLGPLGGKFRINVYNKWQDLHKEEDWMQRELGYFSIQLVKILIVVLATRNVEKTTKVNKLAKLGIGTKKHPYVKTTTITIGKITERTDNTKLGEPTGKHYRPHLRRGHIRHQRYGPSFQFTRDIFIEPIFVNADEGWIAERTAYNVGKAHE